MAYQISARQIFLVISINIFAGLTAYAQSSYELMCRNKAKEIAAETYKNCVTEQRQSQIEQIRKDYKEKMTELKNHYDNELKKISGNKQTSATTAPAALATAAPQKQVVTRSTVKTMRPSGARNLPKKTVKTEVIDLTSPSTESIEDGSTQSQNRLNSEIETPQAPETVELPTQE